MGSQRLLCPHLHEDLPPPQHSGSGWIVFQVDGGGGFCVDINDAWCSNTVKVNGHCSWGVKLLRWTCRPYYHHHLLFIFIKTHIVSKAKQTPYQQSPVSSKEGGSILSTARASKISVEFVICELQHLFLLSDQHTDWHNLLGGANRWQSRLYFLAICERCFHF